MHSFAPLQSQAIHQNFVAIFDDFLSQISQIGILIKFAVFRTDFDGIFSKFHGKLIREISYQDVILRQISF